MSWTGPAPTLRPRTSEPERLVAAVDPVAVLSDRDWTAIAWTPMPATDRLTFATVATASSSALTPVTNGVLFTVRMPTLPVRTGAASSGTPSDSSEFDPLVTSGVGGMSVVPARLALTPYARPLAA